MIATRRDFEATARIIDRERMAAIRLPEPGNVLIMVRRFALDFADYFASECDRFDRDRFLKACGLDFAPTRKES